MCRLFFNISFLLLLSNSFILLISLESKLEIFLGKLDIGYILSFCSGNFEKIEDFLTSKRNYLFKIIKYSKE